MEYLLKASAVIVIFYVCYNLFLQRDTFFEHNRWFLLLGLLVAFTVPFFVIPIYIEYTPAALSNFVINEVPMLVETTEKPFNILDYIPMVYGLGVLFFICRFLMQVASLTLVILKNKSEKHGRYTFVKTTNNISPFSFFNWIVYNPNQFNENELIQIISHEKIHAKQLHSIDILVSQIACVVLWFHPFIWLYNKKLKQNLEFIADQKTQSKFDQKSYQTTLLKTSMPSHQMALSNNFYNSLIKKRIVMLHKSKSKKINLIKYAFVIPLLAAFLMSFNTEDVYVEKVKPLQDNSILSTPSKQNEIDTYHILDTQTDVDLKDMKNIFATKGYTLKISDLKRSSAGLIIGVNISIKNKTANVEFSTSSLLPIKTIKIVFDKENNTISIGNLAATDWKVATGFPSQEKADAYKESKKLENLIPENKLENALFILNGNNVNKKDIDKLNADDINTMDVWKGEKAIEKYGNKGKNGVVEITTKDQKPIKVGTSLSDVKIIGYGENKDSTKVGAKINPWTVTSGRNTLSDTTYFNKI